MVRRRWDEAATAVPIMPLEAWFALAARVHRPAEAPDPGPTWIELLPTEPVDIGSVLELRRFEEWLSLADLLAEHDKAAVSAFGFPERQRPLLELFLREAAARVVDRRESDEARELLVQVVRRLESLVPDLGPSARAVAGALRHSERSRAPVLESAPPRYGSWPPERSIVARVLRDLGPAS